MKVRWYIGSITVVGAYQWDSRELATTKYRVLIVLTQGKKAPPKDIRKRNRMTLENLTPQNAHTSIGYSCERPCSSKNTF